MKIGDEQKIENDPIAVYVTRHLLGHFYLVMRYQ